MDKMWDSVLAERPAIGAQYEAKLQATLARLWRRRQLILKIVAATVALGIFAAFAMPQRYTAEADVHGGFAPPYTIATTRGDANRQPVSFDASLLVETRARLFQSHQLARQVVERLGLEHLRPEIGTGLLSSWLQVLLYGPAARAPDYQVDRAAAKLAKGLSVKTEPRVYRISVRYTAGDPELAAQIANAFVIEFLRFTALQVLYDQRAEAQKALSDQLAVFGEKHPRIAATKARLSAADVLVTAQTGKTLDEIERSAGENVTFARAVAVPSSPNSPLLIALSLLAGLAAGIGLVLWTERDGEDRKSSHPRKRSNGARSPDARSAGGEITALEENTEFLAKFIAQNPSLTLDQALTALSKAKIKSNRAAAPT